MARTDRTSRGRRQGRVEGEKRSWLRSIQGREYRRALFSFEMLLRAMDRFFNLDNHPRFQREPPTPDCDLKVEVAIAEHKLHELIQLSQAVLNEADTSAFMFQSYVETELLSDVDRDELLERYRRRNRDFLCHGSSLPPVGSLTGRPGGSGYRGCAAGKWGVVRGRAPHQAFNPAHRPGRRPGEGAVGRAPPGSV